MVTKKDLLGKLGQVIDPELGVSIVDLGLIYEIKVGEKKGKRQKAFVKMTFTTPACPLINVIIEDVKKKLDEIPDLDVDVLITFEPLWTPERMSERAKIKLGMK